MLLRSKFGCAVHFGITLTMESSCICKIAISCFTDQPKNVVLLTSCDFFEETEQFSVHQFSEHVTTFFVQIMARCTYLRIRSLLFFAGARAQDEALVVLVQGGALGARKKTRGSDQPWPPARYFYQFCSAGKKKKYRGKFQRQEEERIRMGVGDWG